MPDFRSHPAIRERNDLNWFLRAKRLRGHYGRLSALAILAAVVALGGWMWWGDERVYWSAPASSAHAMFQHDCRQCHVQMGGPAWRLASLQDGYHSVRDQDCQQCHAQSSHDHAPRMVTSEVTGCVQCHREHVGREKLAEVANQHCTGCHTDLKVTSGAHLFATEVSSFDKHPEFHFSQAPDESVSEEQRALAAHLKKEDAPLRAENGKLRDRTELRFNHAKHLVIEGIPSVSAATRKETTENILKQLNCRDCHQPDAAEQYMQPVSFAKHCQECHKLEFSSKLALDKQLPHADADVVLGQLRERLMDYANKQDQLETEQPAEEPRLPNKNQRRSPQEKWTWVEEQLTGPTQPLRDQVRQGCAYCHTVTPQERGFVVVPPRMPERWLLSSRFDHGRHREVSCTVCHDPEAGTAHVIGNLPTQLGSQLSSDILMPKLAVCQQCHADRPRPPALSAASARCMDCHDYHTPHREGAGKLDALLRRKE